MDYVPGFLDLLRLDFFGMIPDVEYIADVSTCLFADSARVNTWVPDLLTCQHVQEELEEILDGLKDQLRKSWLAWLRK